MCWGYRCQRRNADQERHDRLPRGDQTGLHPRLPRPPPPTPKSESFEDCEIIIASNSTRRLSRGFGRVFDRLVSGGASRTAYQTGHERASPKGYERPILWQGVVGAGGQRVFLRHPMPGLLVPLPAHVIGGLERVPMKGLCRSYEFS